MIWYVCVSVLLTIAMLLPPHRFMSAYEQKVEAPDKNVQYLLFACDPYETIAFKVRCALSDPPFSPLPNGLCGVGVVCVLFY